MVNAERGANSLPPLKEDGRLDRAAQLKTDDIVTNHYFSHTSPSGLTPWHWFEIAGYDYSYGGENLGEGIGTQNPQDYKNFADLVAAWMNSPLHRANILHNKFTETGIGISEGPYIKADGSWDSQNTTLFVAQYFATPATTQ